jgi:hypothetical protein
MDSGADRERPDTETVALPNAGRSLRNVRRHVAGAVGAAAFDQLIELRRMNDACASMGHTNADVTLNVYTQVLDNSHRRPGWYCARLNSTDG